jgi:hypothetical protein
MKTESFGTNRTQTRTLHRQSSNFDAILRAANIPARLGLAKVKTISRWIILKNLVQMYWCRMDRNLSAQQMD